MKEEIFGGEVRFRVYNVEKIKDYGEEEGGKEGQICPKEIM